MIQLQLTGLQEAENHMWELPLWAHEWIFKPKELTSVTYCKPEMALLGDAAHVINGIKGLCAGFDPDTLQFDLVQPAYELDE